MSERNNSRLINVSFSYEEGEGVWWISRFMLEVIRTYKGKMQKLCNSSALSEYPWTTFTNEDV